MRTVEPGWMAAPAEGLFGSWPRATRRAGAAGAVTKVASPRRQARGEEQLVAGVGLHGAGGDEGVGRVVKLNVRVQRVDDLARPVERRLRLDLESVLGAAEGDLVPVHRVG